MTSATLRGDAAWPRSGWDDTTETSHSMAQLEAMALALDASATVSRRQQFFVWSQSRIHPLVPHDLLVCGAYQRQRRALVFDIFQSVVLEPALLAMFGDGRTPLMGALIAAWTQAGGRSLALTAQQLEGPARAGAERLRSEAGLDCLLVHGVSRPMRPFEVESLFVFAGRAQSDSGVMHSWQRNAELLLPYLHSTWRRVEAVESEMFGSRAAEGTGEPPSVVSLPGSEAARALTSRERQILHWAREGKSNPQIASVLGISPLTVKNHVQNILRKLGASNRAHAVALVMAQDMGGPPSPHR